MSIKEEVKEIGVPFLWALGFIGAYFGFVAGGPYIEDKFNLPRYLPAAQCIADKTGTPVHHRIFAGYTHAGFYYWPPSESDPTGRENSFAFSVNSLVEHGKKIGFQIFMYDDHGVMKDKVGLITSCYTLYPDEAWDGEMPNEPGIMRVVFRQPAPSVQG